MAGNMHVSTVSTVAPERPLCSICLDTVEENDVFGVSKTRCGHIFHTTCLQRHETQTTLNVMNNQQGFHCPNCRQHLDCTMEESSKRWFQLAPSRVIQMAIFSLYKYKHKVSHIDDKKMLQFVQSCEDKVRCKPGHANILKKQQDAQHVYEHADRNNYIEMFKASRQLSQTTMHTLVFYLDDHKEHKHMIEQWMRSVGLVIV